MAVYVVSPKFTLLFQTAYNWRQVGVVLPDDFRKKQVYTTYRLIWMDKPCHNIATYNLLYIIKQFLHYPAVVAEWLEQ